MESPPIVVIKGGDVFVLFLKNLLTYVLFAATREVNLYFVARKGAVDIALEPIANSSINK